MSWREVRRLKRPRSMRRTFGSTARGWGRTLAPWRGQRELLIGSTPKGFVGKVHMGPWGHGAMGPWGHGAMGPWSHGHAKDGS